MVTLETVIGWIGPHKSIEFLKIDIQGLDFFAVQSGGASLSRVKRIQLEVPITDHATLGSPDCREVVSKMKALGFRLALTNETNPYTSGRHHGNGNIPLVTADGKSCKSLNTLEADAFFVRSDLTAAA